MSDRLLIWKESKRFIFGDLNDVVITYDEIHQLTLRCNTSDETLTIIFKEKGAKEEWISQFLTTKKKKKEKDNEIQRAVFLVPHNPVNEKMPLLANEETDTKSCCCTIL